MEEISRRAFLLLTASAGISLASRPGKKFVDKLIPYVIPMQDATPEGSRSWPDCSRKWKEAWLWPVPWEPVDPSPNRWPWPRLFSTTPPAASVRPSISPVSTR